MPKLPSATVSRMSSPAGQPEVQIVEETELTAITTPEVHEDLRSPTDNATGNTQYNSFVSDILDSAGAASVNPAVSESYSATRLSTAGQHSSTVSASDFALDPQLAESPEKLDDPQSAAALAKPATARSASASAASTSQSPATSTARASPLSDYAPIGADNAPPAPLEPRRKTPKAPAPRSSAVRKSLKSTTRRRGSPLAESLRPAKPKAIRVAAEGSDDELA